MMSQKSLIQNDVIELNNLNQQNKDNIYNLPNFNPQIINQKYLETLGVVVQPDEITLKKLEMGSSAFIKQLQTRSLIPEPRLTEMDIPVETPLPVHNYTSTGHCPGNILELNPVQGCNVGCLYCLVTDGKHDQSLVAFKNYPKYVRSHLEANKDKRYWYYLSAKTEAFQEPTLETGIVHNILREFIQHYKKNPDSPARLYLVTKAGTKQLLFKHHGNSILDLLSEIPDRVQYNPSIGLMPETVRIILEPYAAPIQERLDAVLLCQQVGIDSNSVLAQPIIGPYLSPETMSDYFSKIKSANIINYKPEFLTLCMENLAMIGQIIGYFDRALEKSIYEQYIAHDNQNHRKQRERTAPDKTFSYAKLMELKEVGESFGLTMSVCFWVREQIDLAKDLPVINNNGFCCDFPLWNRFRVPNHT